MMYHFNKTGCHWMLLKYISGKFKNLEARVAATRFSPNTAQNRFDLAFFLGYMTAPGPDRCWCPISRSSDWSLLAKSERYLEAKLDMISPAYDFEQFLGAVSEKAVAELITLADNEAVAAWRRAYQKTRRTGEPAVSSEGYQEKLLALIDYLRFEVEPEGLSPQERKLLKALSQNLFQHKLQRHSS